MLLDNSGSLTIREKNKIIRFRHFQKSEQEAYWREQLMLFVPWRNEELELDNVDVVSTAEVRKSTIIDNSKEFYDDRKLDDRSLGDYIQELEKINSIKWMRLKTMMKPKIRRRRY